MLAAEPGNHTGKREPSPEDFPVTFTQEGHLCAGRQAGEEKGKEGTGKRRKERRRREKEGRRRRKVGLRKDCVVFKCRIIHKIRIEHNIVELLFIC